MKNQSEMPNRLVSLSKWYLFYLILARLKYAGPRKTIAIIYGPEGGSYVEQGHNLTSFLG